MQVSHGGPVAALGVSTGAALQQLATQKLGITEVEDQLLMMPGGSLVVWMRVDTTEQIKFHLEATVPENVEPKTVSLPILAKRIQAGQLFSTVFGDVSHLQRHTENDLE